jgi:hypothetical protein
MARKQLLSWIFILKNHRWEWLVSRQQAFEKLKTTVVSAPVLGLPDFEKPFEVHIIASDMAIE